MRNVGDAIHIARVASGMTQKGLADSIGVTQATLSRFEHGDRTPTDSDLEKLAAPLRVTQGFLCTESGNWAPLAIESHMRRRASASPPQWKKAEAQLNLLRKQLAALVKFVDISPTQYLPAVDPESVGPIAAARLVREQWNIPIGPVHHLSRWIESSGVTIIQTRLETQRIDALSQRIGEYPIILLNEAAPIDRKRWTLAHELGHLVMHAEYASLEAEAEANAFAAEFLMPEATIRPYLQSLSLSRLFDLKLEWMVPAQRILECAYSLGAISEQTQTRLYKDLQRKGWRVNEPFSEDLPQEQPELLSRILLSLSQAGLSNEEIAQRTLVADDHPLSLLNFRKDAGLRLVSSR
ncbi:MAG: XRE family transcriptional regulator [Actinomycetaceae bacterium]|nr:XRE family transcriptional regulator [Actinomycetaceae bacterium]